MRDGRDDGRLGERLDVLGVQFGRQGPHGRVADRGAAAGGELPGVPAGVQRVRGQVVGVAAGQEFLDLGA
nr:hypothetical protein [Actinophytocola gossypii]